MSASTALFLSVKTNITCPPSSSTITYKVELRPFLRNSDASNRPALTQTMNRIADRVAACFTDDVIVGNASGSDDTWNMANIIAKLRADVDDPNLTIGQMVPDGFSQFNIARSGQGGTPGPFAFVFSATRQL